MSEFLFVGDCNPDLILAGRDLVPEFGQVEKIVDAYTLCLGGSAAIAACQSARLGAPSAFAGSVGDDDFGRWCRAQLDRAGVDTSMCNTESGVPTGLTVIFSRGEDRAMLSVPGTVSTFGGTTFGHSALEGARHIHFGSYFLCRALRRAVPELARAARASGATVSLDPNWDPDLAWDGGLLDTLQQCDTLFLNREEAVAIANKVEPVTWEADDDDIWEGTVGMCVRAARILSEMGPDVVVKIGPLGAVGVGREGVVRCPQEWVPDTVSDSVGAGDCFDAGYMVARSAGLSQIDALSVACYCGARSLRSPGGVTGQATRDDVAADLGFEL